MPRKFAEANGPCIAQDAAAQVAHQDKNDCCREDAFAKPQQAVSALCLTDVATRRLLLSVLKTCLQSGHVAECRDNAFWPTTLLPCSVMTQEAHPKTGDELSSQCTSC